jgi:hypothetical protein
MSDVLGFPLDACQSVEANISYQLQYEAVKAYVDHTWSLLMPTKSSPIPPKCAKSTL